MMNRFLVYTLAAMLIAAGGLYGAEITVKKGMSKIVKINKPQKAESMNEDIAAAAVISDNEIMIEGRKEGATTVTVMTPQGQISMLVKVKLPDETERVVEIDVQIAEIIYGDDLNMGIDWPALINGGLPDSGIPMIPLQLLEKNPKELSFMGGSFARGPVNLVLQALVEKNYAKILAKPKLRVIAGKRAEFLSGGELPFAFMDSSGKTTIQWKEYGVKLSVEPTVDKKNLITARLRAEASTLDYANSVQVGMGGAVPGIRTRWADTTLCMEQEETVILAGLMQNDESKVTSGVPLISEIPLIGEIFRSTRNIVKKTELVIFVTPRLAGE